MIVELFPHFWFEHEDGVFRLGHEVRLIFRVINALPVENLELAFSGFEPFDCVAFENDGKLALRIGIEFLRRVQTTLKSAEQIFGHVDLVYRLHAVHAVWIARAADEPPANTSTILDAAWPSP